MKYIIELVPGKTGWTASVEWEDGETPDQEVTPDFESPSLPGVIIQVTGEIMQFDIERRQMGGNFAPIEEDIG